MKKNRIMGMIVTAMIVSPLCAQDWNRIPGGDVINSTDYIGARAGSTVPLLLKTIPNLSVDLATSNTLRMRLNPTLSTTINGFAGARNGFLLLSGQPNAFTNANNRAPFTRLHLVDDAGTPNDPVVYAQELGYRPWMRNGITFTGNSDQAYVGHKYFDQVNGSPVNDNTDFVIQWSDNPNGSGWGVDRLKFVFSTTYNAGTVKGAAAFNGMEAMRFWPSSMTTVNVGIGDFAPVGTGDPTERVDILDGRLRIRQLPDDLPANTLTKVLVVDDAAAPSGQRGVVKWRDISAINCSSGWSLTGNNACTAYNGNPCPPQAADRVGIGTSAPIAKLEVIKTNVFGLLGQPNRGIYAHLTGNGLVVNIAVDGHADGTTSGNTTNIGVRGLAENNAPLNYGLQGVAQGAATNNLGAFVSGTGGYRSYGVQAAASGGSSNNYGIYASATGTGAWAGWFQGNVTVTGTGVIPGGVWTPSDAQLKTGIQPLGHASEVIAALRPSIYTYRTAEFETMGLPEGQQAGLIAQDLAAVLPALVTETAYPAQQDAEGNEIAPETPYKAINYTGLIPYLIGAVQEQQQQIAELREQLAACCATGAQGDRRMAPQQGITPDSELKGKEALRIAPNPFTDRTTVSYTVPQAGRMRLEVGTQDGRRLEVLREEKAQVGEFTYEWNTQGLAPGTYLVTLLLDEQVIVKKAVKVGQ